MKLTTLFLLILLPIAIQSQVEVGFRSGVALSKQKFDSFGYPHDLSNHIAGLEAGAMLNWLFVRGFFLQPEITFIQKGGVYPNGTIKTNSLEIATALGFERKCEPLSIFLSSGIFLDRILNKPLDDGGPTAPYSPDDLDDNDWGWGLLQTGGVAIDVGKGWVGLEGRYRYSLSYFRHVYGIGVDGEPSPDPIVNFRNKGWSINLTFKIEIQ